MVNPFSDALALISSGRLAMKREKGIGRGRPFSSLRRGSGECSTSVESSSQTSQDMQFPATSAVGTSTRRRRANQIAKQYNSDDFSRDNFYDGRSKATPEDTASEKPGKKLRKKRTTQIGSVSIR